MTSTGPDKRDRIVGDNNRHNTNDTKCLHIIIFYVYICTTFLNVQLSIFFGGGFSLGFVISFIICLYVFFGILKNELHLYTFKRFLHDKLDMMPVAPVIPTMNLYIRCDIDDHNRDLRTLTVAPCKSYILVYSVHQI